MPEFFLVYKTLVKVRSVYLAKWLNESISFCGCMSTVIQVAIATGFHLFPFRTEKLSPFTPMVLRKWESR